MRNDPNLYDYWPYQGRPKIVWPDGKKLAFWIAPNIEYYEFNPPTNDQRKGWPRGNPDIVGYSQRTWGNTIGHWRMMDLLEKHSLKGSISLSIGLIDHHPEIIEAVNKLNWEFFSHGIYNTRFSYGMSEEQERSVIEDSIRSVKTATGKRIRGYLAPALTHTENTFELIAEQDFWYTCDLFHDDQPQPVKTKTGQLVSIPYSLEINDVITYSIQGYDPQRYTDILIRHFDQLLLEGETSGTVMCIPIHAYLVSQPHRIRAFDQALKHICSHSSDVWFATGAEIADYFRKNYWNTVQDDIEHRGVKTGGTSFATI